MTRIHASLALALTLAGPVASFSRSSIKPKPTFSIASSSSTALSSHAIDSEEDALWLMHKAEECALSDSCSVDDAREYLREVVHIQSSCVAGTLAGSQVCDDVGFAAEVVAGLRNKIETANSRVGAFAFASPGGSAGVLSPAESPMDTSLKVGLLALVCLYASSVLNNVGTSGIPLSGDVVAPFTAQEWWWATRDGYIGDMLSHFFKHGGLVASLADIDPLDQATPFTAQEWVWAMQGGYLDDMLSHMFRNGGL